MSEFDFHITTPRLYISYTPPTDAVCDWMVEAWPHRIPDREFARARIQAGHERVVQTGYGRYLISLRPDRETGAVPFSQLSPSLTHIGTVTMLLGRFPGAPTIPDLGFGLVDAVRGRGYASEAARGLMGYFREERGVREVAGFTLDGNEGAKRVFRGLGFEDRGVRVVGGVGGEGRLEEYSVWTYGVTKSLGEYGIGEAV